MHDWTLILTPLIVLLLVFQLGGLCEPFSAAASPTDPPSQDYPTTVAGISGLVAFWRLAETSGATAADNQGKDASHPAGANPGGYVPAPPNPPKPLNYNGGDKSAAAPGTFNQGGQSLSSNGGGPAVSFNGGYVEVPFSAVINPPKTPGFSVVAGVSPGWDPDPAHPANRVVVEAGQMLGAASPVGFTLQSNAQDHWEFVIGNGAANGVTLGGPAVTIKNATNFLVATYDGATGTMSLYVDGNDPATTIATPGYLPNGKFPLRIAMGAGRVSGAAAAPAVEFPFNGRISGVAIYNRPLTSDEAKTLAHAFLTSA